MMPLCIINGETCVCQPDEGVLCRYADPGDVQITAFARIAALEAQLTAAQQNVIAASEDSLRLIDTIKYLRGIAERGEVREQRDDETVGAFVLGYVKRIETHIEEQLERIAELEAALVLAHDYMLDYIGQERIKYAGYKPSRHLAWDKDEAQVKAALKGGE